ncbi:hypothetical protein [uncultured Paludibaculum sp.]|uniref:hypothetical protein n=1 Tax=uncultured Paludibaculum sp. TaxID=1765020 RepID=UPI002AABBD62|nr:hypothetical protein [uncultured Paludibaculum sp.]
MPEFPSLKTGAVAQYPLGRGIRTGTTVVEFLDGGEQRFSSQRMRRRWVVRMEQLDEGEAMRVAAFASQYLNTLEPFRFTDPWNGAVYERCVLEGEEATVRAVSQMDCGVALVVAEEVG